VQLQNVEAELYRQTFVISVRETPQLTLLHLQKKGTNQQHESFLFLVTPFRGTAIGVTPKQRKGHVRVV
jgi:hypothetical protein